MNGNYTRFMHLIQAAAKGLLQQIPIAGPMLQAVLAEISDQHQEARNRHLEVQVLRLSRLSQDVRRLSRLLQDKASLASTKISASDLELDLSKIVDDEDNAKLASTILLADAEAGNRLARNANPGRRFLYLAADNYASSARTLEIAVDLGFLWRSYHYLTYKKEAALPTIGANPHVDEIGVGDLIVLAFRKNGLFRILLPLIVAEAGEHTRSIDDSQFDCGKRQRDRHQHAPFVLADAWLEDILERPVCLPNRPYEVDPVFNEHSGLNVKPLLISPHAADNVVLKHEFSSPGRNAIWPYLGIDKKTKEPFLPEVVRNWIGQL